MRKLILLSMLVIFLSASAHAVTVASKASVPSDTILIVAVTQDVKDDVDIGAFGPWAIDDYNKQVLIWQRPDGSFVSVVQYYGAWETFAGMKSPLAGVVQTKDGSGTFLGATLIAFEADNCYPFKGILEAEQKSATRESLLDGSYAASSSQFSDIKVFCKGARDFEVRDYSWTYGDGNSVWKQSKAGSAGDIVLS